MLFVMDDFKVIGFFMVVVLFIILYGVMIVNMWVLLVVDKVGLWVEEEGWVSVMIIDVLFVIQVG